MKLEKILEDVHLFVWALVCVVFLAGAIVSMNDFWGDVLFIVTIINVCFYIARWVVSKSGSRRT